MRPLGGSVAAAAASVGATMSVLDLRGDTAARRACKRPLAVPCDVRDRAQVRDEERRVMADRVPREPRAVLKEVATERLHWLIRSGWPLIAETVEFWNAVTNADVPPGTTPGSKNGSPPALDTTVPASASTT